MGISRQLRRLGRLGRLGHRSSRAGLAGLFNLLDDRLLQSLGLGDGGPTTDDLTVGRDKELFKVPLDALQAEYTGHSVLHPGKDGRGLVAVDVQLAEHGEGNAIVDLAEGLDLVVGTGVLAAELVAGESEDFKVLRVLRLELLVEFLEALELRSEATLGGGVDGEDDLAFERGKRERLALFCSRRQKLMLVRLERSCEGCFRFHLSFCFSFFSSFFFLFSA